MHPQFFLLIALNYQLERKEDTPLKGVHSSSAFLCLLKIGRFSLEKMLTKHYTIYILYIHVFTFSLNI